MKTIRLTVLGIVVGAALGASFGFVVVSAWLHR